MSEKIKVEIENKVAMIWINRPEKANALDNELWENIGSRFRDMDRDSQIRVCVITGTGKHF